MLVIRILAAFLLLAAAPVAAAESEPAATEVVILGVDHSAQLVNRRQQPAAMRAFFSSISPAAICIERAPEEFARGDHYEFTYEIQDVIVPWARETKTPLCPFDWLPAPEDTELAFGIADLEAPPLLRKPSGFQGFLTFSDPQTRTNGLFFADEEAERAKHRKFYLNYPDKPRGDFARRLFLYRTFLQARRIALAARKYPDERVLVVVGMMHKDDLERILADHRGIKIVQPSDIASEPGPAEIARHQRVEDLLAIATFNLLGMQSRGEAVDLAWMEDVVGQLQRQQPGAETRLLAARLAEMQGRMSPEQALSAYLAIAEEAGEPTFAWDGVKDRKRIDSYFDPFGNLTIAQRARLEAARIYYLLGPDREAEAIRTALRSELGTSLKQAQLDGYWPLYVMPPTKEAAESEGDRRS